jgi:hypothetical protein
MNETTLNRFHVKLGAPPSKTARAFRWIIRCRWQLHGTRITSVALKSADIYENIVGFGPYKHPGGIIKRSTLAIVLAGPLATLPLWCGAVFAQNTCSLYAVSAFD